MPTLDTFASYIPALIAQRLATQSTAPTEPVMDTAPAATLFADLSGFTPLAEQLAQRGPEGAEKLTRLLNQYFGRLIELITDHGGDVVEFAGDALLAVWMATDTNSPDPPLGQAVWRAAQCAQAIQAQLNDYETEEGTRLGLRIGIGAGMLTAAHIGGMYGRWKLILSGAPLTQVSLAEKQAAPGQVVLSPEARQWLPLRHTERVGGFYLLSNPLPPLELKRLTRPKLRPEAETILRAYLPGPMIARLTSERDTGLLQPHTEWLAELRRVTVLFINLPNFDDRVSLTQAHTLLRTVQAALYRYEGGLNSMSLNERGAVLMGALGLPPLAHEDDAVRGVQAALVVQAELQKLGVRSFIGVTTGRAFCGPVGNATRREYTLIGDVVNLAARLMQAAPQVLTTTPDAEHFTHGLVICDSPTFQAIQKRMYCEPLTPIQVKGKSGAIAIYQPIAERAAPTTQTQLLKLRHQLLGRQTERAQFVEHIQALVRQGQGGVVMIEGEAGLGKSRLLEEARRQAEVSRIKVFSLTGDAIEKSMPYQAWRPLFSALLDLNVLSNPADRRQHILDILEGGFEEDLSALAPLLNVALPLGLPDNDHTAPMVGQTRAENTRALLLQFLQASAMRSPKMIIVEDAHWLDSASWALALAASQQTPQTPLLIVIALRPQEGILPAEYAQLLRLPHLAHLRLTTLSADDILMLARQRLGAVTLPPVVARLITAKAEGNPLFAEELAYALRDNKIINIVNGECQLTAATGDLQNLQFPDTIQGIITGRIDRLPAEQQFTLKVASVIGREFSLNILKQIYPLKNEVRRLPELLSALEQLNLIRQASIDPEPTYGFGHMIIQEVAYELMLFEQRRELHAKIGDAIELFFADRLGEFHGLLATHYLRGEVWKKAFDYGIKAGDNATRLSAYAEARQYYLDALTSLAQLPQIAEQQRHQVDTVLKLTSVAWGVDDPEHNLKRLLAAEVVIQQLNLDGLNPQDQLRLARVHLWIGRMHLYRNTPRVAMLYLRRMAAETHVINDQALLGIFYSAFAQMLVFQGQFGQADPMASSALPLLEKGENWLEWVRIVGYQGIIQAAQGNHTVGVASGQQALERAISVKDRAGIAASYINLCLIYLLSEHWAEMQEAGQRAVEAAENANNYLYQYLGLGFRAWAEGRLNRPMSAHETWRLSERVSQRLGGRLIFDDWFSCAQAELALRARNYPAALRLSQAAQTAAEGANGLYTLGLAHRIQGETLLAQPNGHETEDALKHFEVSLRCFESGAARIDAARLHVLCGEVHRTQRQRPQALRHFQQAQTIFEADHPREAEQVRQKITTLTTSSRLELSADW